MTQSNVESCTTATTIHSATPFSAILFPVRPEAQRHKRYNVTMQKHNLLDNVGIEPTTVHRALCIDSAPSIDQCEAKIIPLDQLPLQEIGRGCA